MPQTKALAKGLPQGLPEQVELTEVPFFPQHEYQCGPAALATALSAAGRKVTPEELVPQVYIPERKGSLQVEMLAAARRHGMVSYALAPRFEDLLREVAAGTPVIVLQNLGLFSAAGTTPSPSATTGDRGTLVLRSGTPERDVMPFAAHEVVWMRSGYWAMVARAARSHSRHRRGEALAERDRRFRARRRCARRARRLHRRSSGAGRRTSMRHVGLANTHHALGELAQAAEVLREGARRDPDSVVVLNNLAQTLSDLGRNEEALPVIERAVGRGRPVRRRSAEDARNDPQTSRRRIESFRRPAWPGPARPAAAAAGSRAPPPTMRTSSASASRDTPSAVAASKQAFSIAGLANGARWRSRSSDSPTSPRVSASARQRRRPAELQHAAPRSRMPGGSPCAEASATSDEHRARVVGELLDPAVTAADRLAGAGAQPLPQRA